MVARRNLKPTLADVVGRLKASVEQSNTKPHGNKVATAGEGVSLADSTGATTVLEGDTLPETLAGVIAADTVAARLMVAGTLRTVHDDGRAVELTGAGYKAWNAAGQLTVDLNGTTNVLTGTFQTAAAGQRVRIQNAGTVAAIDFFASNNADDHLGVWYNATANVLDSVAYIQAMPTLTNNSQNPGLNLYPMRGTFKFQGRWQADSDTFKAIELINNVGMGPGDYAQVWVNYQRPFPTNNAMYYPLITADTAEGVPLVCTVRGQDENGLRVQLNNLSTNKSTGQIIARIVAFCTNA